MRALVACTTVFLLAPGSALAAGDGGGAADLAWRVANLALLLGVLYAFGRKPVQGFFRDRRDRIQTEVETAAQLRQEAEERHARLQRQLADLEAELTQIRTTARERAETERERILADARASAERVRQDASIAIDQELRRARQELRREAADLSVELAGELLRSEVSDSDRDRLLDEFISKVESSPSQGSGRVG
ncbi:MAG: F0F1 ATP synthase subunit B [Myxococcota bacterium]|nr:F0F1 ATP synthase subunit B [Myxococcota bacterium]